MAQINTPQKEKCAQKFRYPNRLIHGWVFASSQFF